MQDNISNQIQYIVKEQKEIQLTPLIQKMLFLCQRLIIKVQKNLTGGERRGKQGKCIKKIE